MAQLNHTRGVTLHGSPAVTVSTRREPYHHGEIGPSASQMHARRQTTQGYDWQYNATILENEQNVGVIARPAMGSAPVINLRAASEILPLYDVTHQDGLRSFTELAMISELPDENEDLDSYQAGYSMLRKSPAPLHSGYRSPASRMSPGITSWGASMVSPYTIDSVVSSAPGSIRSSPAPDRLFHELMGQPYFNNRRSCVAAAPPSIGNPGLKRLRAMSPFGRNSQMVDVETRSYSPVVMDASTPVGIAESIPLVWLRYNQPNAKRLIEAAKSTATLPFVLAVVNESTISEIFLDPYGCKLFLCIFEIGTTSDRLAMMTSVKHVIPKALCQLDTSKCVQEIVELSQNYLPVLQVISDSIAATQLPLLATHIHANHGIQRMMKVFPFPLVLKLLVLVVHNVAYIATEKYGCYPAQRAFDRIAEAPVMYQEVILHDLLSKIGEYKTWIFFESDYGNYFCQYLLENGSAEFCNIFGMHLVTIVERMAKDERASHIIDRALLRGDATALSFILYRELSLRATVGRLMRDMHGCHVLSKAIRRFHDVNFQLILDHVLDIYSKSIKKTEKAKRLTEVIAQVRPDLIHNKPLFVGSCA